MFWSITTVTIKKTNKYILQVDAAVLPVSLKHEKMLYKTWWRQWRLTFIDRWQVKLKCVQIDTTLDEQTHTALLFEPFHLWKIK